MISIFASLPGVLPNYIHFHISLKRFPMMSIFIFPPKLHFRPIISLVGVVKKHYPKRKVRLLRLIFHNRDFILLFDFHMLYEVLF
jgi:hypothetical protein